MHMRSGVHIGIPAMHLDLPVGQVEVRPGYNRSEVIVHRRGIVPYRFPEIQSDRKLAFLLARLAKMGRDAIIDPGVLDGAHRDCYPNRRT